MTSDRMKMSSDVSVAAASRDMVAAAIVALYERFCVHSLSSGPRTRIYSDICSDSRLTLTDKLKFSMDNISRIRFDLLKEASAAAVKAGDRPFDASVTDGP